MANRPVHEIRLGKVKAAIWKNETEAGVRYSVSIVRIFKTEEGWDSSPTFGRDEVPRVAKVSDSRYFRRDSQLILRLISRKCLFCETKLPPRPSSVHV